MTRPRQVCLLLLLLLAGRVVCGCAGGDTDETVSLPGTFSATPGNRAITLSWDADEGVGYTLYWSTSAGVSASSQKIARVTSPYVHRERQNGVRVFYRLQAWKEAASSDLSTEISAVPDLKATSPGAPASVTATAEDGKVSLSWDYVSGVTSYTIYRDTTSGVHAANGSPTKVTSNLHDDIQVTNGVTYYYVVTATRGGVEGPPSAEVQATPTAGGGTTPTNLTATAGNGQVTLGWSPVSGAASYTLYWAATSGVTKASGTAIPSLTSPSHVHSGLTNGTTYYYVVTATVSGVESAASSEASATPSGSVVTLSAPINVGATAGNGQVTVSWAPVSGASGYTVYWQTTSGVAKATATAATGATSPHLHTGLTNGQTYYYAVTASDSKGESSLSKEVSATPSAGSTGHGTVSGALSGGAYGVVMLENTTAGKGIVQLSVYSADPLGSPPGQPVSGLGVVASGAVGGSLLAAATAGTYQNTTAAPLTTGSYTFTVTGSVSGTVTAVVKAMPSCTITSPKQGSSHKAGTDLKLSWSSSNSDKASILLQDSMGTVSYPPLKPDPGGATVPGKDIPYQGLLQIMVSAVWSAKGSGAALAVLDDSGVQLLLN